MKKGFTFYEARIAYERGWNAEEARAMDDPKYPGMVILKDGTSVNPLEVNKNAEHNARRADDS